MLITKCTYLQLALTDGEHCDIKGHQMFQKLLVLKTVLPDDCGSKSTEVLEFITV